MWQKDRSYHSINAPRYVGLGLTAFNPAATAGSSSFSVASAPSTQFVVATTPIIPAATPSGGYAPSTVQGRAPVVFAVTQQASALAFSRSAAGAEASFASQVAAGNVSERGKIDAAYKASCERNGGVAYLDSNNFQACRAAGSNAPVSLANQQKPQTAGGVVGASLPGSGGGGSSSGGSDCPTGQLVNVATGQCVDPNAACAAMGMSFDSIQMKCVGGGSLPSGGGTSLPDVSGNCPTGMVKSDQNTCVDPYAICAAQGLTYDPNKNPSGCSPKAAGGSSAMILGVAALAALFLLR